MTAYRARVGYGKFGRSISFEKNKWGYAGDAEAPQLLLRLARRNPDVEWVIVGRNDLGQRDVELAPNIRNAWRDRSRTGQGLGYTEKVALLIGTLDGVVMHAGQHGTSHICIPQSDSTWTQYHEDPFAHATGPQDWAVSYGAFITKGLNLLGDKTSGQAPVIWVCADPRNYLKARDIKWPTGHDSILAQYQYERTGRHERFQDPRSPQELGFSDVTQDRDGEIWVAKHRYEYGGLELMILPDDWQTWNQTPFSQRVPVGVASTSFNDGRIGREPRRSELIRDYVLSAFPDAEICGKWDDVSLSDVPPGTVKLTQPHEFVELLNRWRVTISLPALGSSWTVAKPLQCWAAGVVCFMADRLDDQGWILPSRRNVPGTHYVGTHAEIDLYSVRDDWTPNDLRLAAWLRVENPEEYSKRAAHAASTENVYEWCTTSQRELLERRWDEAYLETTIEKRLGLHA